MDYIMYASDALAITMKSNPGLFASLRLAAKMGNFSIDWQLTDEELVLLNHLGYFTEVWKEQGDGRTLMYKISWR